MTHEQELFLKDLVRKNDCPSCLIRMKKRNPNMIDCCFRHNNDEHLCDYADKYLNNKSR